MYDLPCGLNDLSQKRQKEIWVLCTEERKDAALNAVKIGLKAMNQVHGYGLQRLCRLSVTWGGEITKFYSEGGERFVPYPEGGPADAGAVKCDIDGIFGDLSERRRRQIRKFFLENRVDAQWNAAQIGFSAIKHSEHFGESRMEQLAKQWEFDIRDFYQDRDIQEPRLKAWIEDIGFIADGDKLQAYKTKEDDTPVRKRTAEKWMAMEDAAKECG